MKELGEKAIRSLYVRCGSLIQHDSEGAQNYDREKKDLDSPGVRTD